MSNEVFIHKGKNDLAVWKLISRKIMYSRTWVFFLISLTWFDKIYPGYYILQCHCHSGSFKSFKLEENLSFFFMVACNKNKYHGIYKLYFAFSWLIITMLKFSKALDKSFSNTDHISLKWRITRLEVFLRPYQNYLYGKIES